MSKQGFSGGSKGKESACNAGDLGSIPGPGRSPAEGNGNPLQYSCLEKPRDRGACWVLSMGSHRVGHDWRDLAAAAGTVWVSCGWSVEVCSTRVSGLPQKWETFWTLSLGWQLQSYGALIIVRQSGFLCHRDIKYSGRVFDHFHSCYGSPLIRIKSG